MGLFKPIWEKKELNDKQLDKACKEISKITNQVQLHDIAVNDNYHVQVRIHAARSITDQALLAELACVNTSPDVRWAALQTLQQREQIISVAARASQMISENGNHPINMAALDKLPPNDADAFVAVMQATSFDEVRFEAARRAGSSPFALDFWERIFEDEPNRERRSYLIGGGEINLASRMEAAERMGEQRRQNPSVQEELMRIVRNSQNREHRIKAAELLSDPVKSRQYAIASRVVMIQGYGGSGSMEDALAFEQITDPEVIDFVLDNKVKRDELDAQRKHLVRSEVGVTALERLYANIDPNSERAFLVLARARFLLDDGWWNANDLSKVMQSPEWGLLERVTDRNMLRRIAEDELMLEFIRWKACEMSGGHSIGTVNCACTVCGFENHHFENFATGEICERCGSKVGHRVHISGDEWMTADKIEHPDGTLASFAFRQWQTASSFQE